MSPHERNLAIFVHGFGSSSDDCWQSMRDLLEADERVTSRFDLDFFDYDTSYLEIARRNPSITSVAKKLVERIEKNFPEHREITLVGHSMGGLVIQKYVADKLKNDRGGDLARLRQVILFATPSLGSLTLRTVREIFSTFVDNAQEKALRVFDPEVSALQTEMAERVVDATKRAANEYPIPFRCFYGLDDDVVPEPSVRGRFDDVLPLPGDHSTIIRPKDRRDERYTQLVDCLLHPAGHRNVFDVDEWGVSLKVEPCRVRDTIVRRGEPTELTADNCATLVRTVKFSPRNRCRELFELSYSTRRGWLRYSTSHRNEADVQYLRLYKDGRSDAYFMLTPRAGETFWLTADIYKGFDAGARDLHFHLGRRSIYKKLSFRLDLTAYLSGGYVVTDEPKLYLHDTEADGCDHLCAERPREKPLPAEVDPRGVWVWEFADVREGVVDVAWDVAGA